MADAGAPRRYGSVLRLRDGRTLGYLEWGDPDGTPLLFFHGMPGCRFGARWLDVPARDRGVHVIALERPGYGLSAPQAGRTMRDWTGDVVAAADVLGIDEFAVAGFSGGGPYAVASCHELGTRVVAAAVVSGAGPLDRPAASSGAILSNRVGDAVAARAPFVFGLPVTVFSAAVLPVLRSPGLGAGVLESVFRLLRRQLPPEDLAVFDRPGVADAWLEDLREALHTGLAGLASDAVVLARPWGFDLGEVKVPVHVWHGSADRNVPLHQAVDVAERIPDAMLHVVEGGGHQLGDHWGAVLDELLLGA